MKRSFNLAAVIAGAFFAGLLAISPAKADVIYNLTGDHCTGGCGPAGTIFGYVDLQQNGTTVDFDVHLNAGYAYAKTGSVDMQAFKFNGTNVSLSDITVDTHVPGLLANTGSFSGDGTGLFHFGISCPTCGNGLSDAFANDIVFHVANATIADVTTSPFNGNSVFVADVGGANGNTGPVFATTVFCTDCTPNQQNSVPEPGSLALFGVGVLGLGFVTAKRRR